MRFNQGVISKYHALVIGFPEENVEENQAAQLNVSDKQEDNLLAVLGPCTVHLDMLINEMTSFSMRANLGFFDSLLTEENRFADLITQNGVGREGKRQKTNPC